MNNQFSVQKVFQCYTKLEIYLHDTINDIYETGGVRLNISLRIKHCFYFDCEFFSVTTFKSLEQAPIPTKGIK